MGNLISRSELLKHSRKVTEYDETGYSRVYRAVSVEDIKYAPTAYDVDKVVKELEEPTNYTIVAGKHFTTVGRAIEIVKGGGVNERD